jgi:ABC-type multidrug transport system fused ATPase/permease subunit
MIDGQDISKISLNQVRSKITIIPQDPSIFKGTLRYNVDPDNRYSDQEILELLKRAELENLVNKNSQNDK